VSSLASSERERRPAAARQRQQTRPSALDQEKLNAALVLVKGGLLPAQAVRQTGLGRSTVYREIQCHP